MSRKQTLQKFLINHSCTFTFILIGFEIMRKLISIISLKVVYKRMEWNTVCWYGLWGYELWARVGWGWSPLPYQIPPDFFLEWHVTHRVHTKIFRKIDHHFAVAPGSFEIQRNLPKNTKEILLFHFLAISEKKIVLVKNFWSP